jgi:hypothetical protein
VVLGLPHEQALVVHLRRRLQDLISSYMFRMAWVLELQR